MRNALSRKAGAVIVAAALLFTGCAPDRGADTSAAGQNSGAQTGGGGAAGTTGGSSGGSGSTTKFGELDSPCGKGNAKGATDQGVTDTEIKIGYGDDRGFANAPGLNKEQSDAVEALIKWCNEQGGINGRKVVGKLYDGALTNTNAVMQAACKSEFMLVGSGYALDATAEATRVGCNLVQVPAWTANADTGHAPMSFVGIPTPVDQANGAFWKMAAEVIPELKTEGITSIATSNPPLRLADARHAAVLRSQGIEMRDCGVVINYQGEPNYVPFAQKWKDCGTKVMWNGSTPGSAGFNELQAMNQVGLKPKLWYDLAWYSPNVAKWNTANGNIGDGMYVQMTTPPFESADAVPALKLYLDLVAKNNGKAAPFGVYATSSFLLWATAAKECGSDLTRQCMVNKLSKVEKWTAGGLHSETSPGKNLPPRCAVAVQLKGDKYEQVAPKQKGQYVCGDLVPIPKEAQGGLVADANRISTKYDNPKVIRPQG